MSQALENVAAVSEENSASVEEVSATAEELSTQVEEVSASAQELAALAEELQQATRSFTLADTDRPQTGAQTAQPASRTAMSRSLAEIATAQAQPMPGEAREMVPARPVEDFPSSNGHHVS